MDILIVTVVYNKKISDITYLNDLENVYKMVYDNSVVSQKANDSIFYFHNPLNPGVSKAYNVAIELANKLGAKYVLLLDQDTEFDSSVLKEYIKQKDKYGPNYVYAPIVVGGSKIYSPFIEKKFRNIPLNLDIFDYKEKFKLKGKSLINSGLMIPLNIINEIGKFNENIKLDFSDTYFVEKYKKYHDSVILINTYMKHSLSGDEGVNKIKELNRFKYFCEGAKVFKNSSYNKSRVYNLVYYRTIRLILKYKTLKPILIMSKYFIGRENTQ